MVMYLRISPGLHLLLRLKEHSSLLITNNNGSRPMELDQAETSNRKSYNQNNNQKSFKGKCYNCGKQEHMSRNCKSLKARITNIENNSQKSNTSHNDQENIEFSNVEENRERLLRISEQVNGHKAWILLDSGASRNFLDESFVKRCQLPVKNISPITVELADGRKCDMTQLVNIKELKLSAYHTSGISAQVINLQRYDAVLGKS